MTAVLKTGKCRICGCTDVNPCLMGGGDGRSLEPCAWLDADRTLCSNPRCVAMIPLEELIELCEAA